MRVPPPRPEGRGDAPDSRGGSRGPAAGGRTPRGSSHEPSSRSSTPFERSDPCLACASATPWRWEPPPWRSPRGLFAQLGPLASNASSHREAPLTAADPQIDNTDVYAFVSPDEPNTVTLVSSWIPFEEPAGGPNFYLWAEHTNYDIKIANDGDAAADITYRWNFKTHYRNPDTFLYNTGPVTSLDDHEPEHLPDLRPDPDQVRQRRKKLINNAKVAPSNVGDASMPNYNADLFDAAVTPSRRRPQHHSWVGPVRRPVLPGPPRVRPPLRRRPVGGRRRHARRVQRQHVRAAGPEEAAPWPRRRGHRGLEHGVASQHARRRRSDGSQTFSGKDVQVSRLGMPLVNEVVVPGGR